MDIEGLDSIDNKILELLKNDARISYSKIGENIGISRVAVKNRVQLLKERGIIQGFFTLINPTKMPESIQFMLDIETYPEKYEEVLNRVATTKAIRQVYRMSGECRIHAIGFAPNHRSISNYVDTLYSDLGGIRRIGCHMVLSTVKDLDGGVDYERTRGADHKANEQPAKGRDN